MHERVLESGDLIGRMIERLVVEPGSEDIGVGERVQVAAGGRWRATWRCRTSL